jgi:AraC family transcriptional regulator
MVDYYRAISRAISYVEDHLCDPFTVEDVSNAAFQSRWHFQRVFRLVTGHSLYKYVQRRRLAEAGSDLLLKNEKIIDLAFKYQYGSPEAFTRAFAREYGMAPKEYKSTEEHPIFPPISVNDGGVRLNYSQGDISYRPVSRGAITLFGKTYRTSMQERQNEKDVPLAWQDFFGRGLDQKIQHRETGANYGVYHNWDYKENFTILLGSPVTDLGTKDIDQYLPKEEAEISNFALITLKPCKYMVFTIPGKTDQEILAGWNFIYGNWMPETGYERDYSEDFDRFDERFYSDQPVSEIYIPIK